MFFISTGIRRGRKGRSSSGSSSASQKLCQNSQLSTATSWSECSLEASMYSMTWGMAGWEDNNCIHTNSRQSRIRIPKQPSRILIQITALPPLTQKPAILCPL